MKSPRFFLDSITSDENFNFESNIRFFLALLGFFFFILFTRVFYLQIVHGKKYRAFSEQNLFKQSIVRAPRGRIIDREDRLMAENLPTYSATVTPQYVEDLETLSVALGAALNIDKEKVLKKINVGRSQNGPFYNIEIKKHLSRDELFKTELLRMDHPGVGTQESILRSYPLGPVASHVVGYVREISKEQLPILSKKRGIPFRPKDIIGKNGLEQHYDSLIRGKNGLEYTVVDAKGKRPVSDQENLTETFGEIFKPEESEPGKDLKISIDVDLQKAAYNAFEKYDRVGSLIALKSNGEVLAWVSYPSFDSNEFSKKLSQKQWNHWRFDEDRPLGNKVIHDHYSPGSLFKPFVALAALQEGTLTTEDFVFSPSKIMFAGRAYHDSNRRGHGHINVVEAIERSSNTFFYQQGKKLGIDTIAKYAKAMGFGQKTGISLAGEAKGFIPTRSWKLETKNKPWQPGETLSASIGQSYILSTGLQLAVAYNSIANNGKVYRPHFKVDRENKDKYLVHDLGDSKNENHISPSHFETVRQGLHQVVNGKKGTARFIRLESPYSISGKTGTVQVRSFSADQIYKSCAKRLKKFRHHGMFAGFAPSSQPEVTVAILTEHSCSSASAGPIAKDFFEAYLNKYKQPKIADARKTQQ